MVGEGMDGKVEEKREGYKKTKLGWIPEDWEATGIDECCSDIFLGLTTKVDYVESDGIPLVRAKDINTGKLSFDETRQISKRQHRELTKYREARKDDVLVSKSGTLGICALVDTEREFSIYESIIVLKSTPEKLSPGFLLHMMRNERIQRKLLGEKVGSSVGHLNLNDFRRLRIPLPSLPEQQKIAEILSTWDKAIESTAGMIEAKTRQKKALAQRLLTGKKRFKEFEGEEWNELGIRELGKILSGGTPDTKEKLYWNGDVPWCTPTEITSLKTKYLSDTKRKITELGLKNSSAKMLPTNSIIVCTRATVGECAINTIPMTTNQGFKNIILKSDYQTEFVYYALLLKKLQMKAFASGSTFLEISKKDFGKIRLEMPSLPEQKRIAAVLSAADREVELLKKKSDALKMQKKGLMQKLLTGKVRVNG